MRLLSEVKHYTENLCPACHQTKIKLVRLREDGKLTLNFTWLCNNPKCPEYFNHKELEGWKWKREISNFRIQFKRQNKIDYNPNLRRC